MIDGDYAELGDVVAALLLWDLPRDGPRTWRIRERDARSTDAQTIDAARRSRRPAGVVMVHPAVVYIVAFLGACVSVAATTRTY